MTTHETRFRVRYAETDQMGVVYHANYLPWMEVGRVELFRSRGMSYRELEQLGILMVVAEATCRYHAPARYDDEIVVRTTIGSVNTRLVEFDYEIRAADSGRRLATGHTKHLFVGANFRPMRLPEHLWELFGVARPAVTLG